MKKRLKMILTASMLAFCLALMGFGVYAAASHTLNVENYISFDIEDNIAFRISGTRTAPSGNIGSRVNAVDAYYNSTYANGGSAFEVGTGDKDGKLDTWNIPTPVVTLYAGEKINWTFTITNITTNPIYVNLSNIVNPWGENATLTAETNKLIPTNGTPTTFTVSFEVVEKPTFTEDKAQTSLSFSIKMTNQQTSGINENYTLEDDVMVGYYGIVEETTIPSGVTKISANSFGENSTIEKITIPANVEKIDVGAMSELTNLKEVVFIGDTAPEIMADAIPDIISTTTAQTQTYEVRYTTSPVTAIVPANKYNEYVLELYAGGFEGNISNGTKVISMEQAVEEVSTQDNWWDTTATLIDESQKLYSTVSGYLYVDGSVLGVENQFAWVGYIGTNSTINISPVINGMPVTAIVPQTLENPDNLTRVIMPHTAKLFDGAMLVSGGDMPYNLTQINISKNIEEIFYTFCYSIPKSCKYIFSAHNLGELFEGPVIDKNNPNFLVHEGNIYSKQALTDHPYTKLLHGSMAKDYSEKTLIQMNNYNISNDPNICEALGYKSMIYFSDIIHILNIPKNIKFIDDIFSWPVVTKIEFEENSQLESIGDNAFNNANNLIEINFENCPNLKSIGYRAICGSELKILDLSKCDKLEFFGSEAFYGCSSLVHIKYNSNAPVFKNITPTRETFGMSSSNPDLEIISQNESFVNKLEKVGNYYYYTTKTDKYLMGFIGDIAGTATEVKNVDSDITKIYQYAFGGGDRPNVVEEVDLSNCEKLTEIGDAAFFCCYNIKSIELPSSLEKIGSSAFAWCDVGGILDLSNCKKLTEIRDYAFQYCESLTLIYLSTSVKDTILLGSSWNLYNTIGEGSYIPVEYK